MCYIHIYLCELLWFKMCPTLSLIFFPQIGFFKGFGAGTACIGVYSLLLYVIMHNYLCICNVYFCTVIVQALLSLVHVIIYCILYYVKILINKVRLAIGSGECACSTGLAARWLCI